MKLFGDSDDDKDKKPLEGKMGSDTLRVALVQIDKWKDQLSHTQRELLRSEYGLGFKINLSGFDNDEREIIRNRLQEMDKGGLEEKAFYLEHPEQPLILLAGEYHRAYAELKSLCFDLFGTGKEVASQVEFVGSSYSGERERLQEEAEKEAKKSGRS